MKPAERMGFFQTSRVKMNPNSMFREQSMHNKIDHYGTVTRVNDAEDDDFPLKIRWDYQDSHLNGWSYRLRDVILLNTSNTDMIHILKDFE